MFQERFTSRSPRLDLPRIEAALRAQQPSTSPPQGASWYSIVNVSASEAEITLYDGIGSFGITAADFVRDLRAIKAPQINLHINSPGGEVHDAIAIFNALRSHSASVTAYIDGIAASAASFIAMAGDRVVMMPHSEMFIHDAQGVALGNAADMRHLADWLDKTSDNIAGFYAEKAGGTVEEWRDLMRAETLFSDREAVDAGLADEIDGVTIEDRAPRVLHNENVDPIVTDPEPTPEPVDFGRLFQDLVDQDDLYAVA